VPEHQRRARLVDEVQVRPSRAVRSRHFPHDGDGRRWGPSTIDPG
jgi:hypothetical protein